MTIAIKTPAELSIMQEGGKRLVGVLRQIKAHIAPGVTLKFLDEVARTAINQAGGKPSFLGYNSYPAVICASVNHGIVHCIPNDYALKDGDLISIDCGLEYQGWHTDAAISWIVGKPDQSPYRPLLEGTYQALLAGIGAIRVGGKVGEISLAIETVLGRYGLTIMKQFVGHGVGRNLHEEPVVPNFVGHDKNVVLPVGSTIAIEPIAGVGGEDYYTDKDNWSTYTRDQHPVAHFEMTVAVTNQGALVLTPLDDLL